MISMEFVEYNAIRYIVKDNSLDLGLLEIKDINDLKGLQDLEHLK